LEPTDEIDVPYLWYSEEEWNHLVFTTRSQLNAILNPLRAYGQGVYVDGAIAEIMKLIDLVTQKVRGKDNVPLVIHNEIMPMTTETEYNADD
jgi:hypothetical protein